MKKHRQSRSRGSNTTEESLRGKNRELQKQIKQLLQRVRQLEKQLGFKSEPVEAPEPIERSNVAKQKPCENCGKEGEIKEATVWSPSGEMTWLICQICKHRERKQ